jgi:hypothetical protein
VQAAREDGGPYPVPRFAAGGIGQADDGEARQPVRDVDLYGDRLTDGTTKSGRCDGCEHAEERSTPTAMSFAFCHPRAAEPQ